MLPQDPVILLSYINTKLRDDFPDLDDLCDSLDEDRGGIEEKLRALGYVYDPERNQFR